MPTIRVDDEVMEALRARAVPFEDTPNSVLRRELGLADDGRAERPLKATRPSSKVASSLERTAQNFYALPLMQMLITLGGRAETGTVLDALEDELGDGLFPADYELLPSGETRWRKDVQWCRFKLVEEAYMSRARRGWWEITDKGRDAVKRGVNPLID